MKTTLQGKGLYKVFDDTEVLKGIDIAVQEGEFVAVMGQSGSGKSTLLYNISGMDRITKGEILFDSEDIAGHDDEKMSHIRLQKMGFIFQQSHLLRTLSIKDNVVLPGFKAGQKSREEVVAQAEALIERTGIAHIADHDIKKVSGGQLQRAAICRALINQPEILFADEPTGALNSSATREIMDIINEENAKGTAVMMVTHDAKVAARADRVIFLADGKITDEINLGKYSKEQCAARESRMMRWLEEQGL